MCIFEYIFDNCSCSLKIIYVTICLLNLLYRCLKKKFIKLIILSFQLYLYSYSMYFFVWYCQFDEFCYINTDCRLLKLLIIVKFTIKIHMALEKYIKITLFLLNMKYLHNI